MSNTRQSDKTFGGTNEHENSVDLQVDYEIGLDAADLTPARIEEISAQQSIFYCRCLFYLLRQAAISEPHHPLFNHLMFMHALEEMTMIGEALSNAAYDHVERLASLKPNNESSVKGKTGQ